MTGERVFEALTDCADELEGEIVARYVHADGVHPAMQHKYDRDMQTVIDARTAITTLRAQVAALAGEDAVERALTAWYSGDAGSWEWVQSFSPDGGAYDRKGMREALDAARGGEG